VTPLVPETSSARNDSGRSEPPGKFVAKPNTEELLADCFTTDAQFNDYCCPSGRVLGGAAAWFWLVNDSIYAVISDIDGLSNTKVAGRGIPSSLERLPLNCTAVIEFIPESIKESSNLTVCPKQLANNRDATDSIMGRSNSP
jgi:hypothetical protein